MNEVRVYKCVVVGPAGVGKTSLCIRLQDNTFEEQAGFATTVGVYYLEQKNILLDPKSCTSILVWDTAGDERYNSLISIYARNANLAIVCFTRGIFGENATLDRLLYYVDELISRQCRADCGVLLVLTKIDIEADYLQTVQALNGNDIVKRWMRDRYVSILPTSSKTGAGISELYATIVFQATCGDKRAAADESLQEADDACRGDCC